MRFDAAAFSSFFVSKGTLGKPLRDGMENLYGLFVRLWTLLLYLSFPSNSSSSSSSIIIIIIFFFYWLVVCFLLLLEKSPWYNRTGWLGVKHQFTYLLLVKLNSGVNNQGWNATLGPIRDPSSKTPVDLMSRTFWGQGTWPSGQTGGQSIQHKWLASRKM